MAKTWSALRDTPRFYGIAHAAGMLTSDASKPVDQLLLETDFNPSGKRPAQSMARTIASGAQPTRRAVPQLLPDGLTPDAHVALATGVPHPASRAAALPAHVLNAYASQPKDPAHCNQERMKALQALRDLHEAVCDEDSQILPFVHHWLRPLIVLRSIAFMREVSFVCLAPDFSFLADYLLGMPKLGWACHAPGALPRLNPVETTVDNLLIDREIHNDRLWRSMSASGDPELDKSSWEKSKAEFSSGALRGPFYSLAECDLPVRLVRRFPIWECHGTSANWKCRNIDDMLQGGQNSTAGTQYVHIPATLDDMAALIRVCAEAHPQDPVAGYTSDFASAYRQATADPDQAHLCAVLTWDNDYSCPAFGLAVAQLFGGKSAGLNFCRIPAWCCHAMSCIFAVPIHALRR